MPDRTADVMRILAALRKHARPGAIEGMARYGIRPDKLLGVSIPVLRAEAKALGTDHELALALWNSGVHEARILASMIADPRAVTPRLLERWVREFDAWDVCDQTVMNLFEDVSGMVEQALAWARRDEEYVKRAGYVLMARLAVSDKQAPDKTFERFYPSIRDGAADPRNYVKKVVSWALRQIGKRNANLERSARKLAEELKVSPLAPARWVGADALRDLDAAKARKNEAHRSRSQGGQ